MNISDYIFYSIIMVTGPQLIVPITLLLNTNVRKVSLYYICGAFLGTVGMVGVLSILLNMFGENLDNIFRFDGKGTIRLAVVAILVFLIIKSIVKRNEESSSKVVDLAVKGAPSTVFKISILLFAIFPTDLMTNIVMAKYIVLDNNNFILSILPLALINAMFVAIPFILYLIFKEKIEKKVPKIRNTLEKNSWIINVVINSAFIYLLLK